MSLRPIFFEAKINCNHNSHDNYTHNCNYNNNYNYDSGRRGGPKGGAPKGGAEGWGAQNFALFFSLCRPHVRSFCLSLGGLLVEFWWCF